MEDRKPDSEPPASGPSGSSGHPVLLTPRRELGSPSPPLASAVAPAGGHSAPAAPAPADSEAAAAPAASTA
eukprot:8622058-Alexandrium_andersonii.AAC.1